MIAKELRLPVAWGHIAAKVWGSPSDERVLLVHGVLDNAGSFDRLISLLPQKYHFVCIDLPGHGWSSHFPAELPLEYMNYVLVIRRVLDSLKWSSCLYIGHSLGATIGLIFSSLYPDRVKRIFCIDAIVVEPINNHRLFSHIKKVHDNALHPEEKKAVAKLYSEDEVLHMLMNLRFNTLNTPAAKALMKRSVTKVGDKYKLNRDKRLTIGLHPLFNIKQHLTILKHLATPLTIVLATATLSANYDPHWVELAEKLRATYKHKLFIVEGNHDVHNNHPERIVSHVSAFLTDLKSNL